MKSIVTGSAVFLMTAMMLAIVPATTFAAEAADNLTGLWVVSNRSIRGNRDENFEPLQPEEYLNAAGLEAIEVVMPAFDPSAMCLASMPRHLGGPYPIEIVQIEGRIVQLFEYENIFRILYTDGREHPDPVEDQRFMGHATAQWEDDAWVVDTRNFNGKAWVAGNGLPVSQNAEITEWYSLIEDGQTMQVTMRYFDEEYFTQPIWRQYFFNLRNDWGIREYFCAEGNRDNVFQQREGLPGAFQVDDVLPPE